MVLKCTSWNIRRRAVLAGAFPETPWIWVQRDRAQVLGSILAKPPGWLGVQAAPTRTGWLFGLDPAAVLTMTRAEFAARGLGAMLEAAATDPARRLCMDHADLPAAVWQRAAPHLGLEADLAPIERMIDESQLYSKDPAPRLFAGDVPELHPMTDATREAAQRFAEPGYRALASGA